MNIGAKIKDLRQAKRMTQSELAGEMITRNMLSRIENGSALPSVPTMLYLAERLGVPAGFLLAEEGNEFYYRKMNDMPEIRRAYRNSEFAICRDMCKRLGGEDDEVVYLLCLSSFGMAKEHFDGGELSLACELFDEVCRLSEKTVYPCFHIKASALAYLEYMNRISPSLYSEHLLSSSSLSVDLNESFGRYHNILKAISEDSALAQTLAKEHVDAEKSAGNESLYSEHIKARLLMQAKNYRDAYRVLKQMLVSGQEMPAPMMYFVFSDLEETCRELSDYKGAYEYSNGKIELIEKFLR